MVKYTSNKTMNQREIVLLWICHRINKYELKYELILSTNEDMALELEMRV